MMFVFLANGFYNKHQQNVKRTHLTLFAFISEHSRFTFTVLKQFPLSGIQRGILDVFGGTLFSIFYEGILLPFMNSSVLFT